MANKQQQTLTARVEILEAELSGLKKKFQEEEQYVGETLGEFNDRITCLEPPPIDPSFAPLPEQETEGQLVYGFSQPEADSYFWQWFFGGFAFVVLVGLAILLFQTGDHVGHLHF